MPKTKIKIRNWRGPQLTREIRREINVRLRRVGEMVGSQVRRNISQASRALGPSSPGQFPHADTGTLRASITFELSEDARDVPAVVVGTNVEYAKFLEEGTKLMDARPFLTATAREMGRRVERILTAPMK